jgi:2-polyprenyl-6-methoxyphenol hydroxylase-like FAD-dependent oxidoreductase
METLDVPVLIAGGGSVGLFLASELGWRGVPCLSVEQRVDIDPHPRANSIASRTMEYLRRWGIAAEVQACGIPSDFPLHYFWMGSFRGPVFHKFSLPPYNTWDDVRRKGGAMREELTWSPYLKNLAGQNEFEARLREYAATLPPVELRRGWRVTGFEQDADGVTTDIERVDGSGRARVRSRYLVACDGGRSLVRQKLGIGLSGEAGIGRFASIYFRAPEFLKCHDLGPGAIYLPLHRDHMGFVLNWDTGTRYTYHKLLKDGEKPEDIDPKAAIYGVLGRETPVEILSVGGWNANALVADRFRDGRVLLAGDAAHLFTPTGAFGMNTGASDAVDLAWKLQASLAGWAGPWLLDSYEIERRPIAFRNTAEAADNFRQLRSVMGFGDDMNADTPDAAARREALAQVCRKQEKLLASFGVVLGYRYSNSPIVVPDGTPETPDDVRQYVPTARPGHRAPHAWLDDERALMDTFSQDFTLLDFGPASARDSAAERDVAEFLRRAHARGVPVARVPVASGAAAGLYERRLALVRPDLMIAWRGDRLTDPERVLDVVTGNG